MINNLLEKKWFKYILIISWVVLLVTFVSKCSFIFRMNDWYDSNCYFTVAYSMKNGGFTLYRDIYEQKGPYLYFMHIIEYYLAMILKHLLLCVTVQVNLTQQYCWIKEVKWACNDHLIYTKYLRLKDSILLKVTHAC